MYHTPIYMPSYTNEVSKFTDIIKARAAATTQRFLLVHDAYEAAMASPFLVVDKLFRQIRFLLVHDTYEAAEEQLGDAHEVGKEQIGLIDRMGKICLGRLGLPMASCSRGHRHY